MRRTMQAVCVLAVALLVGHSAVYAQQPLGTAFTYQGQLKEAGIPADGDYDFLFRLFDDPDLGSQVGGDVYVDDWPVAGGLFTVQLDFGDGVFTGDAIWLEAAVRPGESGNPYTVLSPRQPVTAAPVALYALDGPGSAGYWAGSGTDIYNTNSGNVGVGTTEPQHPFHLVGDLRADGHAALGNSAGFGPSTYYDWVLDLSATITDFSSRPGWEGLRSVVTIDPDADLTGGNARSIYSHDMYTIVPADNDKDIEYFQGPYLGAYHWGSGNIARFVGGNIGAQHFGSGTLTAQNGAYFFSGASGAGSITDNSGIEVWTGHEGSGGAITNNHGILVHSPFADQPLENHYGIYLEDQDFGINDSYAIYNAGGDTYLNGDLEVTGDLRGRTRVAFGNDAAFGTGGPWYPDWPRVFDFSHTISTDFSLAPAWTPVRSLITVDPTGGGDEQIYSHDFEVLVPPSNTEDIDTLQGPTLMATHLGSGTVWRFVGAGALCENNGGGIADYQTGFAAQSIVREGVGTIGENRGIEIWTGHWGSGGSIATNIGLWIATPWNPQPLTDHYGIYLQDQDVGVNDSYAIYVAGGDSYFNGDLEVTGTVSKSGGSFKIDHPLDPENRYLYHSFVESPDMMNIYNGNVVTDDDGRAWVQLPDYFEALNRDFRYQLTVLGQFAQAIVEREIENGGFQIRTDKPDVKVSWQVTGIRQDPWAERNRIPVEEDKLPSDQGRYLHPELYGQPAEMGVHYRQTSAAHGARKRPGLAARSAIEHRTAEGENK